MEKQDLMRQVGNNVRHYRMKRKLSQGELASIIDKNSSEITRIEGGVRSMSLSTLYNLAEALNVSCDALIRDPASTLPIENIISLLENRSAEDLAWVERIIYAYFEE